MKKLIAPLCILALSLPLTGCFKAIVLSDVAPDQAGSPVGQVKIGGWNAGSLVTYSLDANGVMETTEVQVLRDSGVNNTVKIVNSAAAVGQAVGTIMIGVGTQSHGNAWQRLSQEGFDFRHSGIPASNIDVNNASNSSSVSSASASATANASARAGFGG